jgi:serralysin
MPKLVPATQTGSLTDHQHGTDDTLVVAVGAQPFYGDALSMFDTARGGDDVLIGADPLFNILDGDAGQMHDHTRGGSDHLIGADNSFNFLIGDAFTMDGASRGGDDTLTGGLNSLNELFGDAYSLSGRAHGGNDTLTGGTGIFTPPFSDPTILEYGDAFAMHDHARGGDDTLVGGFGQAVYLYGDARTLDGDSRGGDDTLIADSGSYLYGDAFSLSDSARGGDDILVSGRFTDNMWGDAQVIDGSAVSTGADTYVFGPGSGTDYIHDFRQGDHDKIDVRAYDFHDISDLTIVGNAIEFDAFNRVVLVGFGGTLHASDFIFA